MPAPVVTISGQIKQSGPKASASAYAAALRDPGTWASAVGEVLVEDIEQRFQTQSDPWGNAWAALSQRTLRMRAARGVTGRILQITRTLANSKYWKQVGRGIAVGLAVAYAPHQQFGAPNNRFFGRFRAPIPARAMIPVRWPGKLDLPKRLRDEIRATIEDAIKRAVEHFAG